MPSSDFDSNEALLGEKRSLSNSEDGYLPLGHNGSRKKWYHKVHVAWVVAAFFFFTSSMLSVYLLTFELYATKSQFGSFEKGFETDLKPVKPAISAKKMPFHGELRFHENGTMYRENPGPQYFGSPSDEIDKNWYDLLYARGVDLEEGEYRQAGFHTWEEPMGGLWRTGLDVFHQLHCLNMVRKRFDPDYYPAEDPPRLSNMHRDHCLDYIRQSLMCHADATPVRLEWRKESHFLIPKGLVEKFDQLHTCRDFEALHEWSKQRALEENHEEIERLIDEQKAAGIL